MILDKQLIFSEFQAITGTEISENVVQIPESGVVPYEGGQIDRNLGPGMKIPLLIQAVQQFNNLTSLTVTLETADDAGLTTNAQVLYSTGAVPLADLVAGWQAPVTAMPNFVLRDFLGLRYTVAGSAPTTGQITAAITMGVDAG